MPLLVYNACVSDIPNMKRTEISEYSDGVIAYTSNNNINYVVSHLERYISNLESWF
jgi:hypothetical protein